MYVLRDPNFSTPKTLNSKVSYFGESTTSWFTWRKELMMFIGFIYNYTLDFSQLPLDIKEISMTKYTPPSENDTSKNDMMNIDPNWRSFQQPYC